MEFIIDQDEKARLTLNRKEHTQTLLKSNKTFVDKSLNNLDEYMNKTNRNTSPTSFSKLKNSNREVPTQGI